MGRRARSRKYPSSTFDTRARFSVIRPELFSTRAHFRGSHDIFRGSSDIFRGSSDIFRGSSDIFKELISFSAEIDLRNRVLYYADLMLIILISTLFH